MNRSFQVLCALCILLLLSACGGAASPTAGSVPEPSDTPVFSDGHTHFPAEETLTVDAPVSGYCGNTITKVTVGEETFSFWGSDSVALTDILINLAYDPDALCRCLSEYTVDTEFGSGYGVNLSECYARSPDGQAALTAAQAETIRDILVRNCKISSGFSSPP